MDRHSSDSPTDPRRAAEGESVQAPTDFHGRATRADDRSRPRTLPNPVHRRGDLRPRIRAVRPHLADNVRIDCPADAEIEFGFQVDRHGTRRPTKTDGSARTVPIPDQLATILQHHESRARFRTDEDFVFATGTGRPLQQRNVSRALRQARDQGGRLKRSADVPGAASNRRQRSAGCHSKVPSIDTLLRHTVASVRMLAGESVDEVASGSATTTEPSPGLYTSMK